MIGSYADMFDGDIIIIGSDEAFGVEIGFNPWDDIDVGILRNDYNI